MNFFNQSFKISNKKIGKNSPAFIIAEAGVNHDGQLKKAYKLIDLAKKAGADAVKFQTFDTESSTVKNLKKADYQKKNNKDKESQFEMLKKLELSFEDHKKIYQYCKRKKIIFFSTPSDIKSFNILKKLNVPCYKISSVDLRNIPLIKKACLTNKPVIISTGMSDLKDIINIKNNLLKFKNKNIIFLHCVSSYPTNIKDLNIRTIDLLREKLGALIGFSDHSYSIKAPALAVACGASVIEKHFTTNKKSHGPDHKISMNFSELKKMINEVRKAEIILGKKQKKIHSSERNTLLSTKKVFVATKDLKAGSVLNLKFLQLKSGGTGFDYKEIKKLVGKKIKKKILKGNVVKLFNFK